MLMATLALGAIFWIAVTAIIVKLAQHTGNADKDSYCRLECKGFSQIQNHSGDRVNGLEAAAGQDHSMIFGGNAHV